MSNLLRIIGTALLFAAIMIAPPQGAMASITSAPMMQMADGSSCPVENCATMPDCPVALPCSVGMFAIPTADASTMLLPEILSVVFVMTDIATITAIHSDGLRRPPKT